MGKPRNGGRVITQAAQKQPRHDGRKCAVLPKALPPNGVGEGGVNMSPQGDQNQGPAKRGEKE